MRISANARTQSGEILRVYGLDVHVREDGPEQAPAVVLLHGFGCSIHWFDAVTRSLASSHRVIRVDLLGHGCTGGDSALDAESQARTVSGVLDALRIADATVVGHSFGADVALALAERSQRVARVVVVGQAPDYTYAKLPPGAFLPGVPRLLAALHRLTPAWLVMRTSQIGFARGYRIDEAWDDPRQVVLDRFVMHPGMYREVLHHRRAQFAQRPLDARVHELDQPVLAIHGAGDQMYDCATTIARYRAAGAQVAVIDDAGHSPNVERPAELAALISSFAQA